MNTIGCVEEVQGHFIRQQLLPRRIVKAVDEGIYTDAHVAWSRRKQFTIHDSPFTLVMEVNHGRWSPMCPECNSGIATGRRWGIARCFGCGAVYRTVVWPDEIDAIETILLKRPLNARHWHPDETLGHLLAENVQHGLGRDLRKLLPAEVQAALGSGPLLLTEGVK